jgi:serine/threonine protein kinase
MHRSSRGKAEIMTAEHHDLAQIRGHKVLLSGFATQPELLSRLIAEARTMARLRHPNIAEVHDVDVQGDCAFVVMEHLPGVTLHAWCERVGKLARNPGLAAAIAGTLADGLAFAHQHGVVHRDLHPRNVLLIPAPGGGGGFSLKIVDFGVARMVRDQPPASAPAGGLGTPVYKAPEQWGLAGPIDHRADVYALGCILFELLCGHPPFCESDDPAMPTNLADPPPDLNALEPEIPFRFQTLVAGMLAKSAEHRLPSMENVLSELEGISGRRRSQWSRMLRTPREGTMASRGTLVINLDLKTIVDPPDRRPHLPERRLPDVRLLWQRLAKAEWLSRLLADVTRHVARLSARVRVWLEEVSARVRMKLNSWLWRLPDLPTLRARLSRLKPSSWSRLRPHLATLRARLSVLWAFLKTTMGGRAPRVAVIACVGALATGTLLWAVQALLTSKDEVRSGATVPGAPPAGAPSTLRSKAPAADLPQEASPTAPERQTPPVQALDESGPQGLEPGTPSSRPLRVRKAARPVESRALRPAPRRRKQASAGRPPRDEGSRTAGSRQLSKPAPPLEPSAYRAVAD